MQVSVIEVNDQIGVFDIKGATPSFLNGIRRTLLSQVPKLAIDDVTIYDNTSALFDEMVSHRLGLLPVPTDLNVVNRRWKNNNANPREGACSGCNGEGCPNCTVLFTLSKEGPCMVYSGDLVPAADAKYQIVDPKIPIVKLLEGQRVMLEAGAVIGDGIEHAKWQVVNAVGYTEYPVVKVGNATVRAETLEKMQRNAPAGALVFEGSNFRVADPIKASIYLASVKKLYAPDLNHVELSHEPDRWVFRVETDGALHPTVAIRKAVSLLMERLKIVESEITGLKPMEPVAQ